jgi:microcystin degradation protein MlrC
VRAYFGVFGTETNTFSPLPCGVDLFAPLAGTLRGEPLYCDILQPLMSRGYDIVGSFNAFAYPAGIVVRAAYETLRDALLADIRAADPLDAVILFLHGAMVADDYDDCEGDLLARVRTIVGSDVIIGVELDLHCHLTQAMVANSDAIVIYKEYPHVDVGARGAELCELVAQTAEGRVRPVSAVFDCRMIDMYYTDRPQTRAFFDRLPALERDGVLSVSIAHGFPWADVPDIGTKVLVVADDDPGLAERVARDLGNELIAMRGTGRDPWLCVREAIDVALREPGRTVLADATDNTGGGAPGDATFLLREMIVRDVPGAAFAALYDPDAVMAAFAIGLGEDGMFALGGRLAPSSGPPLVVAARVVGLARGYGERGLGGPTYPFGDVAALQVGNVRVVLQSLRAQVVGTGVFRALGIDLAALRVIAVKSMHHFAAAYEPIADRIVYVDAPGLLPLDFARIGYTRVPRPLWPLDPHPLVAEVTSHAG